jgi:hypothetical protein
MATIPILNIATTSIPLDVTSIENMNSAPALSSLLMMRTHKYHDGPKQPLGFYYGIFATLTSALWHAA